MKASVCCYLGEFGCLPSAMSNRIHVSGGGLSQAATTAPLMSGGRRDLQGSLCQCLEEGGCPWTECWDLASLLLCQSGGVDIV